MESKTNTDELIDKTETDSQIVCLYLDKTLKWKFVTSCSRTEAFVIRTCEKGERVVEEAARELSGGQVSLTKLMVTTGKREEGINWELGINIYAQLYIE